MNAQYCVGWILADGYPQCAVMCVHKFVPDRHVVRAVFAAESYKQDQRETNLRGLTAPGEA